MELPVILQNTIDQFKKIPGVGEKTALRQVLFLTSWEPQKLAEFGRTIEEIGFLKKCIECGLFCEDELCNVCTSRPNEKTLCVVENIADCLAVLKGHGYSGLFHILGGTLNPLMGIGPEELNLKNLFSRIRNRQIENVILALNPSIEGDATCSYIKNLLPKELSVERIGFGIPVGGSLEYLDSLTISKALENRRPM